jgi:hypothetical protein
MSRRHLFESTSSLTERLLQYDNEAHYERRDGSRIQAQEAASMSVVHSKIRCDAIITDVSRRGMRLTAEVQFPIGATVIVEWGRGFVPCTVRYCRPADKGWVVGVEAEILPGVTLLVSELMQSAQERNRSLLLPARICA